MTSNNAASVMLKRRDERASPPGRKLLSLKLKALLNSGTRRLDDTSFWAGVVDSPNAGSTVMVVATVVDSFTEFSASREMVGFSS
jgi:hypothetical protein